MVTDKDIEGSTCLHIAVDNGHYEVAKLCLEKRRFITTNISVVGATWHIFCKKSNGSVNGVCICIYISGRYTHTHTHKLDGTHINCLYTKDIFFVCLRYQFV